MPAKASLPGGMPADLLNVRPPRRAGALVAAERRSHDGENLADGLTCDVGDPRSRGRIPDGDQDEGAIVRGSAKLLAEELHRARGVGEGGKAGLVQRGEQDANRDTDRLLGVVRARSLLQGGKGVRRSWLVPATSWRWLTSTARSRSRASCPE